MSTIDGKYVADDDEDEKEKSESAAGVAVMCVDTLVDAVVAGRGRGALAAVVAVAVDDRGAIMPPLPPLTTSDGEAAPNEYVGVAAAAAFVGVVDDDGARSSGIFVVPVPCALPASGALPRLPLRSLRAGVNT